MAKSPPPDEENLRHNDASFNEAVAEAEETARKIGSLISYLKATTSKNSGRKA